MTDEQIKHMADRFLGWKLPDNFSPDGGVSFKRTFNDHLPTPMKREPSGTNLLDATQADAMVRYMIEGMPAAEVERLRRIIGTLRGAFRVNMIRLKPDTSHREIDELLDRIERETV
jgi:hypothetical protein